MTSVRAERAFDGERWRGPTVIRWDGPIITAVEEARAGNSDDIEHRTEVVIPGLTDCAVRAVGYAERPGGPPFAPEEAFGLLSLRHGITTVVDIGNTAEVVAHLRRTAERGEGPKVVSAGPRLVDDAVLRTDRVVDADDLDRTFARLAAEGAGIVSVGSIAAEVRDELVRMASSRGLAVIEPVGDAKVPGLVVTAPAGTRFEVPQLEAIRRWTIEGLLDAEDAIEATPFLPYARHFQQRGGRMGRRMARGVLSGLYGDRPVVDADGRARSAAHRLASRRCLASSGAGAPGLVPGGSLWAELRLMEALSSSDDALVAATGSAAACIAGVRGGRLAPGRAADLLFADGTGSGTTTPTISELAETLTTVVADGTPIGIQQLRQRTEALVHRALQEVS